MKSVLYIGLGIAGVYLVTRVANARSVVLRAAAPVGGIRGVTSNVRGIAADVRGTVDDITAVSNSLTAAWNGLSGLFGTSGSSASGRGLMDGFTAGFGGGGGNGGGGLNFSSGIFGL